MMVWPKGALQTRQFEVKRLTLDYDLHSHANHTLRGQRYLMMKFQDWHSNLIYSTFC